MYFLSQGVKRIAPGYSGKKLSTKNARKILKDFNSLFFRCALVAQRKEHSCRRAEVAGLNPVGGTTLVALRNFCAGPLLFFLAVAENVLTSRFSHYEAPIP